MLMFFENDMRVQYSSWDMAFALLSELSLGRAQCAICVRVVRLWDYCGIKETETPLHVDMVLVDEQGNRMYAEIPGAEAEKFKALIDEGRVYVFRKFIVCACKAAYKPFASNQMIRFTPWTIVDAKFGMHSQLPKYVFDLVDFQEFPSRVGQVECFIDTIGIVAGISEVAYVHLPSNQNSTAKRVISLTDLRAAEFDAETVHAVGQESPVVAVFVGMLLKSYKGETTLSGGAACKWYINEDIPEIDRFFDRMPGDYKKVEWISAGEKQFRALEQQQNLEEKTILQLRDMDPWEFEGSGYRCTVTIARINNKQPWWFSSCTKCHRAAVPCGSQYKCSGGCPNTTAEPKYRLSLIGTDDTATAEFTLFGRVARQVIGKPVVALIRSTSKNQHGSPASEFEQMVPELAALVSHKFTFSVAISQKNLTQRNVSFQVNSVVTFFGKQSHIPNPTPISSDISNEFSAVRRSMNPSDENSDVSTPPKKARLERKVVPCRKKLSLGSSSAGENIHTSAKDAESGAAIAEEPLAADDSKEQCTTTSDPAAMEPAVIAADASPVVIAPEIAQNTSKNRSIADEPFAADDSNEQCTTTSDPAAVEPAVIAADASPVVIAPEIAKNTSKNRSTAGRKRAMA